MILMGKNWRALNYWEDTKSKDKMPARKELTIAFREG
jgi:hypothetical protein